MNIFKNSKKLLDNYKLERTSSANPAIINSVLKITRLHLSDINTKQHWHGDC